MRVRVQALMCGVWCTDMCCCLLLYRVSFRVGVASGFICSGRRERPKIATRSSCGDDRTRYVTVYGCGFAVCITEYDPFTNAHFDVYTGPQIDTRTLTRYTTPSGRCSGGGA